LNPCHTNRSYIDRPKKIDRYNTLLNLTFSKKDEIVTDITEQDLEDVLCSYRIDILIIADEYASK
jgi:hypothetical protein